MCKTLFYFQLLMLLFAFSQISVHIYYMSTLNHISIEIFCIKEVIYTNKTHQGQKLI